MKLLIKIVLFVLVAFVNNVKLASAAISFSTTQEAIEYSSFIPEATKVVFKAVKNDLANSCQNGNDLVDYRKWGIGVEVVAVKGGGEFSTVLLRTNSQLQKKFMKHGADFEVFGKWNPAKNGEFSSAIHQHINSAGIRIIEGTYQGKAVIHYVNPATG